MGWGSLGLRWGRVVSGKRGEAYAAERGVGVVIQYTYCSSMSVLITTPALALAFPFLSHQINDLIVMYRIRSMAVDVAFKTKSGRERKI